MGLGKKTIDDENYAGKRVLVRCDFNVPMNVRPLSDGAGQAFQQHRSGGCGRKYP